MKYILIIVLIFSISFARDISLDMIKEEFKDLDIEKLKAQSKKLEKIDLNDKLTKKIKYFKSNDYNTSLETNESNKTIGTDEINLSKELLLNFNPFFLNNEEDYFKKIKEKSVEIDEDKKLQRFGIDFFKNRQESYESIPISDDYIIGNKDLIEISIYGIENVNEVFEVSMDGFINIPKVTPIKVLGLTSKEAKEVIKTKLKLNYPNSDIQVLIKNATVISVSVVGEVNFAGNINLKALSRVKDALIFVNGINKNGSMREIIVKRDNKIISKLDIYDLIINGNSTGDIILKSGDIVVVKKVKNSIKLKGFVKIPAIYELKENETLKDLLSFSGGISADGLNRFIQIERVNKDKQKVLSNASINDKLYDGDIVTVQGVDKFIKNRVKVFGNVVRRGDRALDKDEDICTLFNKEIKEFGGVNRVFLDDTLMDYFIIKRVDKKTLKPKIISANLLRALNCEDGDNIKLLSEDEIYILNKSISKEKEFVEVDGEVLRVGKYRYFKGMKLSDILNVAGIKSKSDISHIEVESYLENRQEFSTKFYTEDDANQILLRAFDKIYIPNIEDTKSFATVLIRGEINKEGEYRYYNGMTLNDLIKRAFNLTPFAYYDKFELVRYDIENSQFITKVKNFSLKDSLKNSFELKPYDEVKIFPIPNFSNRKTVEIKGEVNFPGEYTIFEGEKLSSLIERAGGFKKDAFLEGVVFSREDIKKLQKEAIERELHEIEGKILSELDNDIGTGGNSQLEYFQNLKSKLEKTPVIGRIALKLNKDFIKFKDSENDIILKNRDSIYIPEIEDSILIVGEVLNPTAVIYKKGKDINDYLDLAGGIKSTANEDEIFIIHADGSSENIHNSNSSSSYLFSTNAKEFGIKNGDIIVVPPKFSTVSDLELTKDIADLFYKFAVSIAALKSIGSL